MNRLLDIVVEHPIWTLVFLYAIAECIAQVVHAFRGRDG